MALLGKLYFKKTGICNKRFHFQKNVSPSDNFSKKLKMLVGMGREINIVGWMC
jgi:hypothetical protein